MLYHISLEEVKGGHFYPRIPENRIEGEDDTTGRICFSKQIEKAITAMPNGVHKMHNLMMFEIDLNLPALFYVYTIDEATIPRGNKISPTTLVRKGLVPDAVINQEVWVTNDVVCKKSMARIRGMETRQQEYKCYAGKKITVVKSVTLEFSAEPKERHYKYKLYNEENCRIIEELANRIGCSTERFPNFIVRVTIPPMVDILQLWETVGDIKWRHFEAHYEKHSEGKKMMNKTKLFGCNLRELERRETDSLASA